MSAKSLLQLCNEISLITENIKEHYPELYQQLEESLITPAINPKADHLNKEDFQEYLRNLKQTLRMQIDQLHPQNGPLVNLTDSLEYDAHKFAKKVVLERNGQKTIMFAFTQNQELKTHSAPHDVILTVLEGIGTITLDTQEPQLLHPGEVIIIPEKVKHSLKALSDFKILVQL